MKITLNIDNDCTCIMCEMPTSDHTCSIKKGVKIMGYHLACRFSQSFSSAIAQPQCILVALES